MVFANNVSYMYIYYHLAIIGKGFLIHIRSHYPCFDSLEGTKAVSCWYDLTKRWAVPSLFARVLFLYD